jgi:hypothetical protein
MLARIRGAETICADIEGLNLGRTFPAVLLASHLVNTADARQRTAFLEACALHVEPGGSVLIQRTDPSHGWDPGEESDSTVEGVRIRHRVVSRAGTVISAVAHYTIGRRTWTHVYRAEVLDDEAFRKALAVGRLKLAMWLDERRTWAQAVPVGTGGSREGR